MKFSNSTGSRRPHASSAEIILGLYGEMFPIKKYKPKPTCIQCGCKLQPGKAGRKCKSCRTK